MLHREDRIAHRHVRSARQSLLSAVWRKLRGAAVTVQSSFAMLAAATHPTEEVCMEQFERIASTAAGSSRATSLPRRSFLKATLATGR
jgi:hypothetical protein